MFQHIIISFAHPYTFIKIVFFLRTIPLYSPHTWPLTLNRQTKTHKIDITVIEEYHRLLNVSRNNVCSNLFSSLFIHKVMRSLNHPWTIRCMTKSSLYERIRQWPVMDIGDLPLVNESSRIAFKIWTAVPRVEKYASQVSQICDDSFTRGQPLISVTGHWRVFFHILRPTFVARLPEGS